MRYFASRLVRHPGDAEAELQEKEEILLSSAPGFRVAGVAESWGRQ